VPLTVVMPTQDELGRLLFGDPHCYRHIMTPRLNVNIDHLVCTRAALQDCLFLSLIVQLSLILYVRGLGFYGPDDWEILALFYTSSDQSFSGLVRSVFDAMPHAHMRPVQILFFAELYRLFGFHPLGFHLANAALFNATILLFYLALRELGLSRLLTLTVPLVYALLPHYSTNRFWSLAGMAIFPSMALYFLSLYSDLKALRAQSWHLWGWKLLSILSLFGSALSYEVVLPLFLLNLLLVWYCARKLRGAAPGKRMPWVNLSVLMMSNFFALVLVIGFKALVTTRTAMNRSFVSHVNFLVDGATSIFYGIHGYGLGLPLVVSRILRFYFDGAIFAISGAAGLAIFIYLYHVTSRAKTELPGKAIWFKLIASGVLVFGLGYAIFLTNAQILFSKTSIFNRTAIAAAVGMAMQLVGGLGWASTLFPSYSLRRISFCVLVALLCVSGFLINNTIASFWVAASRQQQEILTDIRDHVPTLPAGSTLILDGTCSYIGPGIVFESAWDLRGALRIICGDANLQADVVSPRLTIGEQGLSTYIYSPTYYTKNYPYHEKLFLYNFGRKEIYQLKDAATAQHYFQTLSQNHGNVCRGDEFYGAWVF